MNDNLYIKRLKERLHQDPDSRLFLSLAEELRKRDLLDEATAVLVDGIRKNPGFIAARLTLGRWYLSGDMLSEAKKEFQEIIKKDPDNASAKKRLSEINRMLGVGDEPVPLEEPPEDMVKEDVSLRKDAGAVISRLNMLMDGIRTRFAKAEPPHKDAVPVADRLNKFLEGIKIRFRPEPPKKILINRLNKLSEAIRIRFAA
jgi:tetratricopeptide (TPR) repeat protein